MKKAILVAALALAASACGGGPPPKPTPNGAAPIPDAQTGAAPKAT